MSPNIIYICNTFTLSTNILFFYKLLDLSQDTLFYVVWTMMWCDEVLSFFCYLLLLNFFFSLLFQSMFTYENLCQPNNLSIYLIYSFIFLQVVFAFWGNIHAWFCFFSLLGQTFCHSQLFLLCQTCLMTNFECIWMNNFLDFLDFTYIICS